MEIITRGEARIRYKRRYFTGKPCSRGHLSSRYVATGACVRCVYLNNHKKEGAKSGNTNHHQD